MEATFRGTSQLTSVIGDECGLRDIRVSHGGIKGEY
jgi:hypothetical protein